MARRLEQDGLGQFAAEVVDWLTGLGYLDDAAYARARARALTAPGKLGPRLAERRLVTAGIPPEAARQAVAAALLKADLPGARGVGGEAAEAALAGALAEKRSGGAPLDGLPDRDRARLARFLLGRGFSGRAVSRVLGVFLDGD